MHYKKEQMISALNDFQQAYETLNELWNKEEYVNLNELNSITEYPFHKSFDELGIAKWVSATTQEIRDIKEEPQKFYLIKYKSTCDDVPNEIAVSNKTLMYDMYKQHDNYKQHVISIKEISEKDFDKWYKFHK